MAKAIKVGRGRAEVTITGALAAQLDRDFRRLLGPVADAMQAEADKIMDTEIKWKWPVKSGKSRESMETEIRWKWPVKSGKSRESMETVLRVDPGSSVVEVVFRNDQPYIRFIRSTKVGKREDKTRIRSPLVTHIRKPARAARRVLAKRTLPPLLAGAIQKRFDDAS